MKDLENSEHSILILDEDQDLRSVLKSFITERFGRCKFYTSKTAQEAINIVNEVQIDVILSPLKNNVGLELLSLCREFSLDTPVIILSGDVSVQAYEMKKHGAFAYVFKGSGEEPLFRAIRASLCKAA